MLIGRVIGDVVATQKAPSHEGRKILVIQPLNLDGTERGEPLLALDAVDAGIGERVLLATEGFSAMTAVGRTNSPIDHAVIGIIDSVDLQEN
jgi:microcompartment protein CcmK/EutM